MVGFAQIRMKQRGCESPPVVPGKIVTAVPTGWTCSGTFLSKFIVLQLQVQFLSLGDITGLSVPVGSERRIKVSKI